VLKRDVKLQLTAYSQGCIKAEGLDACYITDCVNQQAYNLRRQLCPGTATMHRADVITVPLVWATMQVNIGLTDCIVCATG